MISRNLILRLLIAAIFIPILIYVFDYGGMPFLIFVELLIIISFWEFFSLMEIDCYLWQKLLVIILAALPPLLITYSKTEYILPLLLTIFFITTLPFSFTKVLGNKSRSIALMLFGAIYLSAGFSSLILIRETDIVRPDLAGSWIIFLFASIWIIDTAAYGLGYLFKGPKLSVVVSPNKTISGFIGGFVGAVLTALIFNFIFLKDVGFVKLILPALIIAFFGQLGDLVESIFKREIGKKDSSNLIPGHGGALDRFDSLLFAAPALFLYLKYIH